VSLCADDKERSSQRRAIKAAHNHLYLPLNIVHTFHTRLPLPPTFTLTAMPRKAAVKYRSLRSNLVHLPLSLYASLAQSQTVSSSDQYPTQPRGLPIPKHRC
jgi:peroxin-1